MKVVVTGSAGAIGREVVAELGGDHDVVGIDRRRDAGAPVRTIRADLGHRSPGEGRLRQMGWEPRWERAFGGADAVVHLAANPSPSALWPRVLPDNISATWRVLESASRHRVPKVVYASSHRAVLARTRAAFETGVDEPVVDSETPPDPLSAYGVSKGFGEIAGRRLVSLGQLRSFLAIRIGTFLPDPPDDPSELRRWIRPAELRLMVRRCVERDIEGFHILYGVSWDRAARDGPIDLTDTCALLGLDSAGGAD